MSEATTVLNPAPASADPSTDALQATPPDRALREAAISALREAIAKFTSQADFITALREHSHKPIASAHVANWIKRGGVTADIAMNIEAISGVKVERLRPGASWHVVRGCAACAHAARSS